MINYWVSPWKNRALFSNSALGFLFWLLQSKVVSNLEVSQFTNYLSFGIYLGVLEVTTSHTTREIPKLKKYVNYKTS